MAVLTRKIRVAAVVPFVALAPLPGSTRIATEYEVKAAFLCNFAEFVEWPAERGAKAENGVTIGILGRDPFGPILEATVKNRAMQNRALFIRRLSGVEEAVRCQILYVSSSENRDVARILRALGSAAILTVSDIPDFAAKGGVIGFTLEDERVRFQINVAAADRAGLRISARLLSLAHIVGAASPRED